MHIRSVRNDDWPKCLALDASYETEIAWQLQEQQRAKEWGMYFREVQLPRKQTLHPPLAPEELIPVWEKRASFWVAAERLKVRGYLGLELVLERHAAYLTELVVDREQRRQQLGSALLHHATGWSLRKGVEQLILAIPLKAQPALAFAQQQGFTPCGFQDNYWPGQEAALLFRKYIR
ncbi:MAG: GNAT family N-acetyltransferase [Chloroflexota bacterium]|nr:GNAT family N-acetyltransferase [Chloroflexota bacterium]